MARGDWGLEFAGDLDWGRGAFHGAGLGREDGCGVR
jgi:hypothetical protein